MSRSIVLGIDTWVRILEGNALTLDCSAEDALRLLNRKGDVGETVLIQCEWKTDANHPDDQFTQSDRSSGSEPITGIRFITEFFLLFRQLGVSTQRSHRVSGHRTP